MSNGNQIDYSAYTDDELREMAGAESPVTDKYADYSDDELREMAGIKPSPEPIMPKRGIGAAWEEITTPVYGEGGMTDTLPRIGEKILRTAGHLGEAAGEAMVAGVKGLYNLTTTEETRKRQAETMGMLVDTDFVKSQLKTFRGLGEAYGVAKKEYPRAAGNIEAGLNALNLYPAYQIGKAMVPAVKVAGEGIIKAPGAIKNAFYPEPTFEEAMGQILQGKTRDIAKGIKAVESIDTSDVKSFMDLGKKLEEKIPKLVADQDIVLLKDPTIYSIDDLATIKQTKSKTPVKTNYVSEALDNLEELYTKINDPVNAKEISELRLRAEAQGLTKKEVNDIARTYNSEFGSKAFSADDVPLTSVNAQAYENVRRGLKEVSRRGLDDTSKEIDDLMSSIYNTKRLINKNVEKANALRQKIDERGIGEKIGRIALTAIDVATMGTLKGAFFKMLPRGLGYKTKNFLDLEESLRRNLNIINKASKKVGRMNVPSSTIGDVFSNPLTYVAGVGMVGENYPSERPPF